MLAIQYIRDNAELVKKACENKQLDPTLVDQLLSADGQRRELQQKVDAIRAESNAHAKKIKESIAEGNKPTPKQIETGKEIKQRLQEIAPTLTEVEKEYQRLLLYIPNVPADDTPIGPDETGNVVARQVGDVPQFDFKPKQHHELMEPLGMLDTKRAVNIAGFRAYFLKGDGVLLEQALLQYAQKMLIKEGFTLISPPVLVNDDTMWGTGYFPWGSEDHYKTQDDQVLTGTSEVAITAFHKGETLREKDLPIKMAGISPCFRREVGTYGKDTKGIIRVHQFQKVEQVVYTVADEEETRKWHEKMTSLSEQLLKDLELPYQVLAMCTGDMGAGQRKKYDIETWFPGQDKYRETHSASYFNDFQARRLNIRYEAKDGTKKFVYTLNNTMAASPRLLAAVIENYQNQDGTIRVPKVLQEFMGKEEITK